MYWGIGVVGVGFGFGGAEKTDQLINCRRQVPDQRTRLKIHVSVEGSMLITIRARPWRRGGREHQLQPWR